MNKTENILLDLLNNERIKDYNGFGSEEIIYNYKMQFFITSCKSLNYKEKGIGIDYNRYDEEIKLLKYYINGTNRALQDFFNGVVGKLEDDSVVYRIIPLVIVNENLDFIEKEIVKNIILTTKNSKSLLNGLLYSYVLFDYLKNDEINFENIKYNIIKFSIKKHMDSYNSIDKKYILNFEKNRVKLLEEIENILMDIKSRIKSKNDSLEDNKDDYQKLIISFSNYLINIKKGTIDIENFSGDSLNKKIKITEGNVFDHYLLGKSKIVKRDKSEFYIKTKYGLFKFRKI